MNTIDSGEVRKLPLWKSCLEKMVSEGVEYGKTYPADFFEQELSQKRDSMKFGLDISEIRRGLEKLGFYLSGRGQGGNQYIVLPPANNASVMSSYSRAALDALKRGVILGTNTRLDTLSDSERKRHESILERLAIRSALMHRSVSVSRFIKSKSPKLLKSADVDS